MIIIRQHVQQVLKKFFIHLYLPSSCSWLLLISLIISNFSFSLISYMVKSIKLNLCCILFNCGYMLIVAGLIRALRTYLIAKNVNSFDDGAS